MNGRTRIPHAEMVERLRGMVWSKRWNRRCLTTSELPGGISKRKWRNE